MRTLTVASALLLAATGVVGLSPSSALADTTTCHGLRVTIRGTPGDDRIEGTPGDDVINGRGGVDVIDGNGGDDTICGAKSSDELRGGGGNDWIDGRRGNDRIYGGPGDDNLHSGFSPNDEHNHNWLQGGSGDDALHADGNDTVDFSDAPQGVDVDLAAGTAAGDGQDTISHGDDPVSAVGSAYDDTLLGSPDSWGLSGGEGDDVLVAGSTRSVLSPGPGANTVTGGPGNDVVELYGDDLPDVVHGNGGDDRFTAVEGSGLGPNDELYGDGGDDHFDVRTDLTGHPILDPGDESDAQGAYLGLSVYRDAAPDWSVVRVDVGAGTVTAGDVSLAIPGFRNVWIGKPAADVDADSLELLGSAQSDMSRVIPDIPVTEQGFGGDDWLMGGPGDDDIDGGPGTDHGSGGPGTDTCTSVEVAWSQDRLPKSCETDTP